MEDVSLPIAFANTFANQSIQPATGQRAQCQMHTTSKRTVYPVHSQCIRKPSIHLTKRHFFDAIRSWECLPFILARAVRVPWHPYIKYVSSSFTKSADLLVCCLSRDA
eukprot:1158265-Pelagomonas_calceolata.AAC.1